MTDKNTQKPFDAAAKKLVDVDPMAWIQFLGFRGVRASIVDADFNQPMIADRVIRVFEPDYLANLELQASYDAQICHRLLAYNVAAGYKHKLPVETIVVLLRKAVDHRMLTGRFRYGSVEFSYLVVKVWEREPEEFLTGPLALLPFTLLGRVRQRELPKLIRRMRGRTETEAPQFQKELWSTTHLLLGLKYKPEQSHELLKGVFQMLDLRVSSTYQSILQEGREEGREQGRADGERQLILLVGSKRFGEPDELIRAAIGQITSTDRLTQIADKLLDAASWQDLLKS